MARETGRDEVYFGSIRSKLKYPWNLKSTFQTEIVRKIKLSFGIGNACNKKNRRVCFSARWSAKLSLLFFTRKNKHFLPLTTYLAFKFLRIYEFSVCYVQRLTKAFILRLLFMFVTTITETNTTKTYQNQHQSKQIKDKKKIERIFLLVFLLFSALFPVLLSLMKRHFIYYRTSKQMLSLETQTHFYTNQNILVVFVVFFFNCLKISHIIPCYVYFLFGRLLNIKWSVKFYLVFLVVFKPITQFCFLSTHNDSAYFLKKSFMRFPHCPGLWFHL